MTQDNAFARDQIERYREARRRLDDTHRRASSDLTTGLFNRRVGEGYLRLRLADSCPVTVLMLDVSPAQQPGGDWLQSVGQALVEYNGTFEMVCRWDAGRFVLIAADDLRGNDMAAEIKRRLNDGVQVHVRFSIEWPQPGDTAEDVVARLEAQLS